MNTESNTSRSERPVTAAQLAIHLGVTVSTVLEWCTRGLGPRAYFIGEYPMFEGSDVQDWLEQRRESGLPTTDES